ncbi:conserved hypothetical protein [Pirellula staleyi DSM 6068]|uniref:Peptidase S9 prolyl oligopeptidase catalytic domain-containing protein n=1 Tax=Pirellula staleyi (strain ATCC 27377 / DSM 6068 / ICPB 4128) TaxID=530564 RepID=D2QXH7_PIRSD|nr:prolyl oligopeptidase family serine peptidase [Pirellula staleyi]ADB16162.1 conserved hypothetical protein [Pirellula staleyi DSM 6068]
MRNVVILAALVLIAATGCGSSGSSFAAKYASLTEARQGFKTTLTTSSMGSQPVEEPPQDVFQLINYTSKVGELPAYITPDPLDGKKHPAIIWITGGDCNSIGDVWSPADPQDDQSASAYRQAGIVMMFPSLRGGNTNPGQREGFFGEVDDVIAAADFLATQSYVDPARIYLGGHSTGGTLALVVAESTSKFRATFAFGPVHEVQYYDPEYLPFAYHNTEESAIRSPIFWLKSLSTPTFAIEGADGNALALTLLERKAEGTKLSCIQVSGADHFSVLGPANTEIARQILADTGPTCNISLSAADLQ